VGAWTVDVTPEIDPLEPGPAIAQLAALLPLVRLPSDANTFV
jgi:hypothetical protein